MKKTTLAFTALLALSTAPVYVFATDAATEPTATQGTEQSTDTQTAPAIDNGVPAADSNNAPATAPADDQGDKATDENKDKNANGDIKE